MASSYVSSPNVASSSLPYPSGNVMLVTHVLPAASSGEPQAVLDGRQRFRRGHPKALGAVQVMIGVTMLLFGIVAALYYPSLAVYSGIFVWGSLIYISSGSVTVAAEKHLSRCLINASLVLNIIASVVATIGVVQYSLDAILLRFPRTNYFYAANSAVLAVFQFLEFIISVTTAAFACSATCGCCTEPQTFTGTVDVPTAPQAHFQAASVAPAQPHPQAEPDFKTPEDLSSDDPPAYQPN